MVNSCSTGFDWFWLLLTQKRVSSLDLEIYILMVSALAFVLLYDFVFKKLKTSIFPWSRTFLQIKSFTWSRKFSTSKYFSLMKEVSSKAGFFHKKWVFVDQEGYSQAKMFPLPGKFSSSEDFSINKSCTAIR